MVTSSLEDKSGVLYTNLGNEFASTEYTTTLLIGAVVKLRMKLPRLANFRFR